MAGRRRGGGSHWHWLLLIPFFALLWVPFYNSRAPAWAGIPFFYWYQFLWIVIGAVLVGVVYVMTERE